MFPHNDIGGIGRNYYSLISNNRTGTRHGSVNTRTRVLSIVPVDDK